MPRHWDQLRASYVRATPRQRLVPIVQRVMDPLHWGPNLLITGISAVEAFARSLVVEARAASEKKRKADIYEEVKETNAVDLVLQYLAIRKSPQPARVFGEQRWRSFCRAVNKYRHVVLHECTYLNAATLEELNRACRDVLVRLIELSGHRALFDQLVAAVQRDRQDIRGTL